MALSTIPFSALSSDASNQGVNFRNLIINGDMSIAQRGGSVSGITTTGYKTLDRFYLNIANNGTYTMSQDTDVPSGQGFGKSLKLSVTTADASLTSGSAMLVEQKFEGQNLQHLKKGTSNAESLTLSFWVKSNKTGTYICEIDDNDNSRNINKSYTIDSADTWEKKTITFVGDTTGTLDNDNGYSVRTVWWLSAGTAFTSGTLATSWESTTNANRAVGQVNLADSTSNYINITGVQLEVGTSASDFEFLPYDVNLQRCQRYFFKIEDTDETIGGAFAKSASQIIGTLQYPVVMRGAPSATNNSLAIRIDGSDELQTSSSGTFSIENTSDIATTFKMSGFTIGNTDHGFVAKRNSGSVEFSAEL